MRVPETGEKTCDKATFTAFAEVDTALKAHQKTKELVEVLIVQVKVLTKYLELATLRYNNGQTDYLNVLDAERTLFAAQLDLAAAEGEAFTTLIQLYAALRLRLGG